MLFQHSFLPSMIPRPVVPLQSPAAVGITFGSSSIIEVPSPIADWNKSSGWNFTRSINGV